MVAVPSVGRADQSVRSNAPAEADAHRLYEQYARQIQAYCFQQLGNREEAEDATQSTFLNAFRGLQRGVTPEFEMAWLYKIAHNVCLTRRRSSSRRRRVETPGDLDALQDVIPARQVDSDELIGLPEALNGMPKQQRRALLLREWQGLSYREIATELGVSQAAVETLLFRARRSLAASLEEEPKKGVAQRVVKGGDAGSWLTLLKSLLVTGGSKVAATVATVAATSVVAATPVTRHAVENAVTFTSADTHRQAPAHTGGAHASHRSAAAVPGAATAVHLRTKAPAAATRDDAKRIRKHAPKRITSERSRVAVTGSEVKPAVTAPATSTPSTSSSTPTSTTPSSTPSSSTPPGSTPSSGPTSTQTQPSQPQSTTQPSSPSTGDSGSQTGRTTTTTGNASGNGNGTSGTGSTQQQVGQQQTSSAGSGSTGSGSVSTSHGNGAIAVHLITQPTTTPTQTTSTPTTTTAAPTTTTPDTSTPTTTTPAPTETTPTETTPTTTTSTPIGGVPHHH